MPITDPIKRREYYQRWFKAHPGRRSEYDRQYYQKHREKKLAYLKQYRERQKQLKEELKLMAGSYKLNEFYKYVETLEKVNKEHGGITTMYTNTIAKQLDTISKLKKQIKDLELANQQLKESQVNQDELKDLRIENKELSLLISEKDKELKEMQGKVELLEKSSQILQKLVRYNDN